MWGAAELHVCGLKVSAVLLTSTRPLTETSEGSSHLSTPSLLDLWLKVNELRNAEQLRYVHPAGTQRLNVQEEDISTIMTRLMNPPTEHTRPTRPTCPHTDSLNIILLNKTNFSTWKRNILNKMPKITHDEDLLVFICCDNKVNESWEVIRG